MTDFLLQDLAIILLVCGVTALACHRLNQPKLVGYVLAGILIGPHTPPFAFIRDESTIRTLGEIGVIFLMFSLGLDFNLRKLRQISASAIITACLDVSVMVWLGYLLGRRLGWSPTESLFLGAILCDSSTTILARILQDLGRKRERFAQIAIGITLVEDVLAVVLIAVLTGLAMTGAVQSGMIAVRLWRMFLFLGGGAVVGLLLLPRLLDWIHRLRSDELMVVLLVGLCFGMALLAANLELNVAIGAVLIGAIVSETRSLPRIVRLIAPLRHVFSAVFFVTIGLRLDPAALWRHAPTALFAVALVLIGKFLANGVGMMLAGHSLDTLLKVGAGMAQVGEFAFIISALALSLGTERVEIYQIGVAAAVITTLLNPYLIRGADRLAVRLKDHAGWRRWDDALRFYSQWIDRLGRIRINPAARRVVRRSITIAFINILLIGGIFGVVGYLARAVPDAIPAALAHTRWYPVLLWIIAATASLPLYVVTFRKLDALNMMWAEVAVPVSASSPWARAVRLFLNHALTAACGIGLALLTFILSSTLLPSVEIFLLLALVTVTAAVRAHVRLSRLYARAEGSLKALFTEPPADASDRSDLPELSVESVGLSSRQAAGQTLRSLDLRAHSGANVVALVRDSHYISNPNPDLPFKAGDRLYLMGSPEEIAAARTVLADPQRPADDTA